MRRVGVRFRRSGVARAAPVSSKHEEALELGVRPVVVRGTERRVVEACGCDHVRCIGSGLEVRQVDVVSCGFGGSGVARDGVRHGPGLRRGSR